ncbi:MAG: LysE family translocator, partial [Pseudomonadota bacterium]
GRNAGWWSAVGLHIGGYVHVGAAAFGLAVLLEAVPVLYGIVKFAGAAYLIWLGVKMFSSHTPPAVSAMESGAKPPSRAIGASVVVAVLNPKTALFYLAFLPQFTDMAASLPIWAQILVLGTIVNFMFSVTDTFCVLLSERMARLLSSSRSANRLAHRIGGGMLIALGVNVAASRS